MTYTVPAAPEQPAKAPAALVAPAAPDARAPWAAAATRAALRIAGAGGRLAGRLADLSLPRSCLLCSSRLPANRPGLCAGCLDGLPGRTAARCVGCAIGLSSDGPLCAPCLDHPPPLDACLALADYEAPLDRVIQALKFQQQWPLGQPLGAALGQALAPALSSLSAQTARTPACGAWLLCPVPLSESRLRERGFNQSLLIARGVRKALIAATQGALPGGVPRSRPPVLPLLRRSRETLPQTLLDLAQRRRNLDGAFALRPGRQHKCRHACVVLVDDVMTTGATLNSAARTLKEAGAAAVIGLIVARAA